MQAYDDKLILLFDGVCNLCNGVVQFIMRHDVKSRFLFASLQSEAGQKLLQKFHLDTNNFKTFVLVENELFFTHSTAALRVAKRLNGLIPLLYAFIIVPKFIRDGVYGWVSRNRYRWFGKRDFCMVPTPDLKEKFLP